MSLLQKFLCSITVIYLVVFSMFSQAQCLEENDVLIPEKTISKSNSFGHVMSSYDDYLLASSTSNDSLEFDGGLVYLYKIIAGQWEKKAELTVSSHNLQMYFGRKTAITNNLIVVAGNTISPEGFHYDELFIYSKQGGDEWTNTTESYKLTIRNDLNETGLVVNEMVIHENILGVSYYTVDEYNVTFYEIGIDNSLSQINTVKGDIPESTGGSFGKDFDFNSEYLAVGEPNFKLGNARRGRVSVYLWVDILSNSNPAATAYLIPKNIDQQAFSYQVEVEGNTIYATNGYSFTESNEYPTDIYIFDKPASGWVDASESAILSTETTTYYGDHNNLKVYNNYVFLSRASYGENIIYGLKKNGTKWQNAKLSELYEKQDELEDDSRVIGIDFEIFNEHIVFSYSNGNVTHRPDDQDKLISFYAAGGIYENISIKHQDIVEKTYSASGTLFGHSMSYSKSKLAVGAPKDKRGGKNTGAVYIYKRDPLTEKYVLSDTLSPPDGRPGDSFGSDVELVDSLLFVSSLYYDSLNIDGSYFNGSTGKVYQYELQNGEWILKNYIFSPSNQLDKSDKHFGRSISYSDNALAVSQYYTGSSESNGKVHIFKMNEDNRWIPIAEMKTEQQQGGDFFGRKVILRDSLLVVGTGNSEYGSNDEMRVYLFKRKGNKWVSSTEDAYLISSDKLRYDGFGFSFDMHRNLIVVGAPRYNYGGAKTLAGKAYIFRKPVGGWLGRIEESLILEPKTSLEEDFFGHDVFIDDNQIVVGAASSINNPASVWFTSGIADLQPGKIYFFNPFSEKDQLIEKRNESFIQLSQNNRYLDGFGYRLEKSNDRLFVSAVYDNNESGFRAGGVYDLKFTTYIQSIESPVCVEDEPFQLKSNILGGIWSGEGIIDSSTGLFDPSLIQNDGWNIVTYTAGECTVYSSLYIGSSPKLISKSAEIINKCKGEKTNLFVHYSSRAKTKWYFRSNYSESFQQIASNIDSLAVIEQGYYKVEIENEYCGALNIQFEVNEESNNVKLNHSDYIEICAYENENLTLLSSDEIENISWYYKGVNSNSFLNYESNAKSILPNQSGFYFANYQNKTCIYNSDTVEVYYNTLTIELVEPPTICDVDFYQLNASPEGGIWTGYGINTDGLVDVNQLGSGQFQATYSMSQGACLFQSSMNFEIILLPKPQIEFSDDQVCENDPVILSIANNYFDASINWFNQNGLVSKSNELNTDLPGDYSAQLQVKGCEALSDQIQLFIKSDSLFVPNVVTKNNDGYNDDFRIYFDGTNDLQLKVFNRWGDEIYRDNDNDIKWNPEQEASGVYYWYIDYLNCHNQKHSAKGWVHVISN